MRNAPLNYVNLPQQNKRGLGLKGITKNIGNRISEGIDNLKEGAAVQMDFRSYKKANKDLIKQYPDFDAADMYNANVQKGDTIVSTLGIKNAFNKQVVNREKFQPGGNENVRKVGIGGSNYAIKKQEFSKYKLK